MLKISSKKKWWKKGYKRKKAIREKPSPLLAGRPLFKRKSSA